MLEAPIAIVALCAPAIGQLINRAIERGSLSSLFSIFSTGSSKTQDRGRTSGVKADRSHYYGVNNHNSGTTTETSSNQWPPTRLQFGSTTEFAVGGNSAESHNDDVGAISLGPVGATRVAQDVKH